MSAADVQAPAGWGRSERVAFRIETRKPGGAWEFIPSSLTTGRPTPEAAQNALARTRELDTAGWEYRIVAQTVATISSPWEPVDP